MAVGVAVAGVAAAAGGVTPAGGSAQQSPVVEFGTPGVKSVTLTVCNAAGCSTVTRQVVVAAPGPVLGAVTVAPARAEVGETIELAAQASGRPPLEVAWQVLRAGAPVAELAGAAAAWGTAGMAAGEYSVQATASNQDGSAAALPRAVLLLPKEATRFYTVAPCRLLDTRQGGGALVGGGAARVVAVAGACGVGAAARAVAVNVTAVGATAAGAVSVFPADYPQALVSSVDFAGGAARAASAVLPLSTDGAGALAASAVFGGGAVGGGGGIGGDAGGGGGGGGSGTGGGGSGTGGGAAGGGQVDLLLDVSGYFAAAAGAAPVVVEFGARLCAFGFCEVAAGTPVWFTQAFAGGAAVSYRYDWTGDGVFGAAVGAPVTSHVFSQPGYYWPVVEAAGAAGMAGSPGTVSLQAAAPIFVSAAQPASVPAAPAGVAVAFAGFVGYSTMDPTLGGGGARLPSFVVSVAGGAGTASGTGAGGGGALLGYDVYVSRGGGAYLMVAALDAGMLASEPVVLAPIVAGQAASLEVAAVNYAGEGPRSAAVAVVAP
jgi:hypothetical protein